MQQRFTTISSHPSHIKPFFVAVYVTPLLFAQPCCLQSEKSLRDAGVTFERYFITPPPGKSWLYAISIYSHTFHLVTFINQPKKIHHFISKLFLHSINFFYEVMVTSEKLYYVQSTGSHKIMPYRLIFYGAERCSSCR